VKNKRKNVRPRNYYQKKMLNEVFKLKQAWQMEGIPTFYQDMFWICLEEQHEIRKKFEHIKREAIATRKKESEIQVTIINIY
jgi:hypothetical protein